MPSNINLPLALAGAFNLGAAFLHIAIVAGGPRWYRAFGASPRIVAAAEAGGYAPAMITFGIAGVLTVWASFAFSGAGVFRPFPLTKLALIIVSTLYLARGLVGFLLLGKPRYVSATFIVASSLICLAAGIIHAIGLLQRWPELQ